MKISILSRVKGIPLSQLRCSLGMTYLENVFGDIQ
jgi:hypothetical protein